MDAKIFTCLIRMFWIPVSCSLLCISEVHHLISAVPPWLQWPHGDLLIMRSVGRRPGMKSKYLRRGLTLAVWAQAGAPVCLGSVRTVSNADQLWISVVLRWRRHLPGLSNDPSCTCCALCPVASRHGKTCRDFLNFNLSAESIRIAVTFSSLNLLIIKAYGKSWY